MRKISVNLSMKLFSECLCDQFQNPACLLKMIMKAILLCNVCISVPNIVLHWNLEVIHFLPAKNNKTHIVTIRIVSNEPPHKKA